MIETKNCLHCERTFNRNPQYSDLQWSLSKYCCRRCAAQKACSAGTLERFFSFISIDPVTRCWLWTGARDAKGYGFFDSKRAHRCSFELCVGDIPGGLLVLHRCDVRNCVNPYHLFLGTDKDNAEDKNLKGRGNNPRGEAAGSARLTEDEVRSIIDDTRTQEEIARQYGIAQTTVSAIKRRQNWSHIQ